MDFGVQMGVICIALSLALSRLIIRFSTVVREGGRGAKFMGSRPQACDI